MSIPQMPADQWIDSSKVAANRRSRLLFTCILLSFCIYSAVFIFRTSYVVEGKRYFLLFDDSMVSMRYAKNLAVGYGLVWNPGEKVEGFTNPLWVVYMSVFHLFNIDQSKTSLFIQISGALFLLLNLFFVKKIVAVAISQGSHNVALFAVLLTAFYLPLNNWGLQGTEVSLLTLLTSICVHRGVQYLQNGASPLLIYWILGAATLIRLDVVVLAIAIIVFFSIQKPEDRKQNLSYGLSILIFFLVAQTIFRYWYYGELLPNTYYLKMTGFPILLRITRGLFVFSWFAWHLNFLLFLVPVLVTLHYKQKPIRFLFWIFAAQVGYSIFVGGDAWEGRGGANRYIAVVMPLFFILFSLGTREALSVLKDIFHLSTLQRKTVTVIGIVVCLLQFNGLHYQGALAEWLLLKRPLNVEDNYNMLRIGLMLRTITTNQAKIAVVWAGNAPYFSNRIAIDLLGRCDKRIAREPMRIPTTHARLQEQNIPLPPSLFKFLAFYPGHLKWNYAYSIGKLKPDVIVQLFRSPEEAKPYIANQYKIVNLQEFPIYLRKDSQQIIWDAVSKQ
jgi:hypothetical protein